MAALERRTTATRRTPLARAEIVRDPDIFGGEPTVAGTRIPVRSIVVQWQYDRDFERVRAAFPRLSNAAIRAALAYYRAHRDEIDRAIEESEQAASATD